MKIGSISAAAECEKPINNSQLPSLLVGDGSRERGRVRARTNSRQMLTATLGPQKCPAHPRDTMKTEACQTVAANLFS